MLYDMRSLSYENSYKLLTATVTPRPIAWVTTRSPDGINNAAPFSFFNVMGDSPPTIAIGLQRRPSGGLKDTAQNILLGGDFIVHLVPQALAAQMNATSVEVPGEVDEILAGGISTVESHCVNAPRIVECPIAFECRKSTSLLTGPEQIIVVANVLFAHIDDDYILDAERCYLDTPKFDLVSRMHGKGWYAKSSDLFQMTRPGYSRD